MSSNIDANDNWAINLGISFFLDYDAHNQRFLIDGTTSSASGNLNVHSYLDRNTNGQLDEADWALANVKFSPLPIWRNLRTNQVGNVSLPGVPVNQPFTFSASSIEGIETKLKDYTIYTHPGSRINIEIPFEIVTHISGFVMMSNSSGERAVSVGTIILTNVDNQDQLSTYLDLDGFFEFNQLAPGTYTLQVTPQDLSRLQRVPAQGILTFTTPSKGGFFELAPISLVTASDALPNNTIVKLNSHNGEAYYFAEQLNNNNLYATSASNKNVNNQEIFEPNMPENTDSEVPVTGLANMAENIRQANKDIIPELRAIAGEQTYLYTLQMGAYSQVSNAQHWINNHPEIDNCKISLKTKFHIINCGNHNSIEQAQNAASAIKELNPELSPFAKKVAVSVKPQNSYTIQLLVASKEQTIKQFVDQHSLIRSELTITNKAMDGRMLMFVTQGNFSTKALAQAQLALYDAQLQRSAWIKHLGTR